MGHARLPSGEPATRIAVIGASDVAGYLLDRKLLSPRAVVDGRFRVVDSSRLHPVFVVTAQDRCFVLKLGGAAVAREAAVLARLSLADRSGTNMSPFPALVAYDGSEGALIFESAPNARDLAAHHARGRFSCALAREAGRALALTHALPPAALQALPDPQRPASSNHVHRPDLDTLRTLTAAATDLTRVIQGSDELCAELDELFASRAGEAVIHGDVRWDNFVVTRDASRRWTRLQLIDWELCGVGDPAVDVGSFLGEYLRAWLRSIPVADPEDAGRLLPHARLPLRRMRPAVRAFWAAYVHHRRTTSHELRTTLHRSSRFAAVRLLTAALEEAQALGELRWSGLHLLGLGQNILRHPDEAAHLLGIGVSEPAS
jgi:aminoglycoside phosphotransferase (APT) family kinase protein